MYVAVYCTVKRRTVDRGKGVDNQLNLLEAWEGENLVVFKLSGGGEGEGKERGLT